MRNLVIVSTLVIGAAVLVAGCQPNEGSRNVGTTTCQRTCPQVGDWVPNIPYTDCTGNTAGLLDSRADSYLVAFVGSACTSTAQTNALTQQAFEQTRDVKIVEISTNDANCAQVTQCALQRGVDKSRNHVVLCDSSGLAKQGFNTCEACTVMVVDADGQIQSIGSFANLSRMSWEATKVADQEQWDRDELLEH